MPTGCARETWGRSGPRGTRGGPRVHRSSRMCSNARRWAGGRNSIALKRKASTRGARGRVEFRRRAENAVAFQTAVSHAAKGAASRMRVWSCRRVTLCGALRRRRPSLVASAAPRNRGRSGAVKGGAREAPCAASR